MTKMTSIDPWIAERTGLGQSIDQEKLESYQMAKMRQIVEYAKERSPFYRKLYADVDPSSLRKFADLSVLPLISAKDICEKGRAMVCQDQSMIKRIVTLFSSGSDSAPKRVYFSANDLDLTVDFFANGMSTMTAENERVMICMPCERPDCVGDLLAKGLVRFGAIPCKYGVIKDYGDAAQTAERVKPHCLVGFPVQMLRLAETIPRLRPKTVLLSADYVPTAVRNRISALWDCQVYAHYGMTESGLGGAVECGANAGYHIRHGDLLFEIIDPVTGKTLPDGKTGEIVISTLNREAMPLIRYRTGDIACLLNNKCPCGSSLKRLGKVKGRYCDTVSLGGGKMISLPILDEILFAIPAVLDYTASLNREGEQWHLTIKILSGENLDTVNLKKYLQAKFDDNLQIELYSSDSFETDGRQKRKLIMEEKNHENICSGN